MGYRAGLVLSTFKLIGIGAGIIISNMYYTHVAEWISENSQWVVTMRQGIENNFIGNVDVSDMNNTGLIEVLKDVPMPDGMKENFIKSDLVQNAMLGSTNEISKVLVDWITNTLVNLVSIVLIFLVVIIVVKILGLIIDKIVKIPVLNEINQFGGFLFGVVKGIIYVMVLMLLVPPVSAIFPNLNLMETLNSSQIALYFHKYNIVYLLFRLMIKF